MTHYKQYNKLLDACELKCPLPILKLRAALHQAKSAEVIKFLFTSDNTVKDLIALCAQHKHIVLYSKINKDSIYEYWIKKA